MQQTIESNKSYCPLEKISDTPERSLYPVPQIVESHRANHPPEKLSEEQLSADSEKWQYLPELQREVIVHVLSRFVYGLTKGIEIRKALSKNSIDPLEEDLTFIKNECEKYLGKVCGQTRNEDSVQLEPKALTPNFKKFFDEILTDRLKEFTQSKQTSNLSTSSLASKVRLLTANTILGHGLGALSGIWGMNALVRKLDEGTSENPNKIRMNGLISMLGQFTLIERRVIAYGLDEIRMLAKENYFLTILNSIREFKNDRPIIEAMRSETFNRWGEGKFPFEINQKELADAAKKRVINWLMKFAFIPSKKIDHIKLLSLEEII